MSVGYLRERRAGLTNVDGLDADPLFDVSCLWVVADLVRDDFGFAKRVHERRTARSRGTWP